MSSKEAIHTRDLFIEALSLPSRSRASLAQRLLISLEREQPSVQEEELWDVEAKRRYQAFRKGKIKARGSDAVFREAYKRVK